MRGLKRLLTDKSTGFKFIFAFSFVILVPMAILAIVSYKVIDSRLKEDTQEKITMGLKTAWTDYNIRGEQMRYGMLQAAAMIEIKDAVRLKNRDYLKRMMIRWKEKRPYVDLWIVTDENGRVISRLNSEDSGDTIEFNGVIEKAIFTGDAQISTEIIEIDVLKREGEEFHKQFIVPVIPSTLKDEYKRPGGTFEDDALAIIVVVPVRGENHGIIGAIVTADILNNDTYLPDSIAEKIPDISATIAMDGLRITTNVKDSKGRLAIGTLLSNSVMNEIKIGISLRGEWNVLGNRYISAFDPVKDNKGRIIGSLFIGAPKARLWSIQLENLLIISAITIIGLAFSLVIAIIFTNKTTRPLKLLREKADLFAKGDIEVKMDIDGDENTNDEIKIFAHTFNAMVGEIRTRNAEEERYLKELEKKNKELIEAHEKISTAYEELEVAYEETQSQSEELNSANEELKLLNEDLDKKNVELTEANRTIKIEEDKHKKIKDKLSLIYNGLRSYLLLVSEDCSILEANKHFMNNFKLNDYSVTGIKLYEIFGLDEKEHQKVCPVIKSIKTKEPAEFEFSIYDGKILRWNAFPLIEDSGSPPQAVVHIEDITEQRLLQQKLIQTDKLSSLGELVSGVAHELNNPLTGIMGYSEILMNEAIDDKIRRRLKDINEASHRCKRIIENLLTFARWQKPEKKYSDINNIIRTTVELRAYQLKVEHTDVELNLCPELPNTMLDEHQLQQVLLNLINNAHHAIKETEDKKGKITITTNREGNNVKIQVSDTGTGIPNNIAQKIFDPFFTTKDIGKGTGLGLSISYGITKEHGGNIYAVNNKDGKGSTFVIELPIIEDKAKRKTSTKSVAKPKPSERGLRALILDDEPTVLELLKEVFTVEGFSVDTTTRGDEALKLIENEDYDIIISDIKIPDMDGKEFYHNLKSIKPEAVSNIIFISGDTASKETKDFLKESGNLFLHKPFTIEQLKKTISKQLSIKK